MRVPFPGHELVALIVAISFAAGLNVYATVATLGLLAHAGVLALPEKLTLLASWWVIGTSGVLFALEFLADKIPAFDLIWNALHTFIRVPVAALLAYRATAHLTPAEHLLATALGGLIAFAAHGGKTAVRAAITPSPEPLSNIGLSLGEDVLAIGLTWLATRHPVLAGSLAAGFVVLVILLMRTVWRGLRRLFRGAERALGRGSAIAPAAAGGRDRHFRHNREHSESGAGLRGRYSEQVTPRPYARSRSFSRKMSLGSLLRRLVLAVVAAWLLAALTLVAARWIDPPTTALQTERRMQSWFQSAPYHKRCHFVPLSQISPNLQHAVIAAEDARFYQHHGFDWHQMQIAAEGDLEGGRMRGASTLTQQMVKNLFFGTGGSIFRKGAEFTLVPVAELVLGKRRILEIYLNIVEWGPGIYGADAACRAYDQAGARNVSREQAARLAAILPAPLRRRPARMNRYSGLILERMRQMGW